jgi:hypothetical protein
MSHAHRHEIYLHVVFTTSAVNRVQLNDSLICMPRFKKKC